MHVFLSAYLLLETAAKQLDDQDQASADDARAIMDKLWRRLTQQEREHIGKQAAARLSGTLHDAELWDAFAKELAGRTISIPADLAVERVAAAARRIADRIRH